MSESNRSPFDLSLRDKRLLARIIEKLATINFNQNDLPAEVKELMADMGIDFPHLLLFFKHKRKLDNSTNNGDDGDDFTSASQLWNYLQSSLSQ